MTDRCYMKRTNYGSRSKIEKWSIEVVLKLQENKWRCDKVKCNVRYTVMFTFHSLIIINNVINQTSNII